MAKIGVTVWWIERDSGEIHSHHFTSVPNNGSYESEVLIKYAVEPIEITVVPDDRSNENAITRLKERARTIQAEREQGAPPGLARH